MNEAIESAVIELAQAREKYLKVIREVQANCKHFNISECDYYERYFGGCDPPMRVCLDCGLVEDGWGCGYETLKGKECDIISISREDLIKIMKDKVKKSE